MLLQTGPASNDAAPHTTNPLLTTPVSYVSISSTLDTPNVRGASSRRWTDMDPVKLMATVSLTTASGAILSHPLYLVLARQQCHRGNAVSFTNMVKDIAVRDGVRGFFRGCPIGCVGMVAYQGSYYALVDLWKEFGPIEEKPSRDFSAGVVAEAVTTPLYSPFGVVCQRQMVAGFGIASQEAYGGALHSTRHLLQTVGPRALFRGMGITLLMLPIGGCWWALYEYLKMMTYTKLQATADTSARETSTWAATLPKWATSTTDNIIVNFGLGSAASCAVSMFANPLFVVRSRVQIMEIPTGVKIPTLWVARDLLQKEGIRGCFRGLKTNIAACMLEGAVFASLYEGVRFASDVTSI